MRVAIYPGSFDPIHNGTDIATRAAALFVKSLLRLCVPQKSCFLDRGGVTLALRILNPCNIEVTPTQGCLRLARRYGDQTLVEGFCRGSRTSARSTRWRTLNTFEFLCGAICLMTRYEVRLVAQPVRKVFNRR